MIEMNKRENKAIEMSSKREQGILKITFFLIFSVIFLCKSAPVSADLMSKETEDIGFVSSIVIRQEMRKADSISIIRPVAVDLKILNIINTEGIKSLRDYEQWLQKNIKYRRDDGTDVWSLPDETLRRKYGDCEDLAFLNVAFLRVAGYQPKAMGLLRKRGRKGHAICVFKKSGYYLWFDNTKLNKTSATSMDEFAKYILRTSSYAKLFKINRDARNQNILSGRTIE